MLVKIVSLLTMLSMSINGFLPRSITELSGNSFLVDVISCQSVFLDFLHFSDKSLVEIAVKTVDDMSVSVPVSTTDARETSVNPWMNVCRALEQSNDQLNALGSGLMKKALPLSQKDTDPSSPTMDNTSSDYFLINSDAQLARVSHYVMHGFILATGGVCLVVSRLSATYKGCWASFDISARCLESGYPPQGRIYESINCGRDIPIYMMEHFSSFLPRSGIDATVFAKAIY
jgi:hypothetical protein